MLAGSAFSETLEVKGSSTVLPVVKKVSGVFTKETGIIIKSSGGGSSFGGKFALKGGLGMASRELKKKETDGGVVGTKIGTDGIAFIVNASVSASDLTKEQLIKIFTGATKDWSGVGGGSGAIKVVGPNKSHGTHGALLDILGIKGKLLGAFTGYQYHSDTFQNIADNAGTIGWVPLGQYQSDIVEKKKYKAKGLKVGGVEPTVANISSGTYTIFRPLFMLTKGAPAGTQKKFVDFLLGPQGQEAIAKEGFVKN